MSKFDSITIENSPYDPESIVAGLIHDFKNSNSNLNSQGVKAALGGTINLELFNKTSLLDTMGIDNTTTSNITQD